MLGEAVEPRESPLLPIVRTNFNIDEIIGVIYNLAVNLIFPQ
jgi:hypothetical protein